MTIFLCLRWWYSAGWQWVWQSTLIDRSRWIMQTFSAKELLKTLFAPFRQTYAGKVRGGLDVQVRAFFDKLISRVIGLVVRLILLFMALVGLLVVIIVSIICLLAWPLIPLLPIISLGLYVMGVK